MHIILNPPTNGGSLFAKVDSGAPCARLTAP